jgi:hypothetical protein
VPTLVALLTIVILPMIPYYTGIASSAAAGTGMAGALLIFSSVEYLVQQDFSNASSQIPHRATPTVLVLVIVALVAAHAAVAWTFQPFDGQHFVASLVPLILMILAGCCFAQMLKDASDSQVDRAIRWCFLFFCISALGSVLGFAPPSPRQTLKPVFPFNEPSHFGIIFTPFLIFCCIRARGFSRYAIWLIGMMIAASLQNLTLIASCAVAALAFVRGAAVIPVVVSALAVGMFVDLSYYLSRLDLSSDNSNLSVLAYIQGWQLIAESLTRSGGWGLGFQQLGLHGTDVPAAQAIFEQIGDTENLLDGAFNFAKVVSEFGVFGMLLTLAFVRLWWRSIRGLRRIANGAACASPQLFAMCVIAGYFVELFVRGAGYFTGSGMLLAGAVWMLTPRDHSAGDAQLQSAAAGDTEWN